MKTDKKTEKKFICLSFEYGEMTISDIEAKTEEKAYEEVEEEISRNGSTDILIEEDQFKKVVVNGFDISHLLDNEDCEKVENVLIEVAEDYMNRTGYTKENLIGLIKDRIEDDTEDAIKQNAKNSIENIAKKIRVCQECNGQIEDAGTLTDHKTIVLRCECCGLCYLYKKVKGGKI